MNEGILDCHRNGILTATTLMATGRAFRHAVELAKSTPSLDVGCHLMLVQSPGLPADIPSLLWALTARKIDPRAEFARQVTTILKAGVQPTHLDTHKHTHLMPAVRQAVFRVSQEFGIPWIRKPVDFVLNPPAPFTKRVFTAMFKIALRDFDRRLAQAEGRRTDRFTGFQLTGRLTVSTLSETLRQLPDGVTELMCHPGFLRENLAGAATRLKQSRDEERIALCSPAIRAIVEQRNIQLTSFREL